MADTDDKISLSPLRTMFEAAAGKTHGDRAPSWWPVSPENLKAKIRDDRLSDELAQGISGWVVAEGITQLASLARGQTATVFDIRQGHPAAPREVLRVGLKGHEPMVAFDRAWCPLVLQPFAAKALEDGWGTYGAERLPYVEMVLPGFHERKDFAKILDDVLRDTPYRLDDGVKDLGVLCDATPVFVDPDVLNYSRDGIAEESRFQFDPLWQQDIMATIDRNCRAIGWPEALAWVVRGADGTYRTKQDILYPRQNRILKPATLVPRPGG